MARVACRVALNARHPTRALAAWFHLEMSLAPDRLVLRASEASDMFAPEQ